MSLFCSANDAATGKYVDALRKEFTRERNHYYDDEDVAAPPRDEDEAEDENEDGDDGNEGGERELPWACGAAAAGGGGGIVVKREPAAAAAAGGGAAELVVLDDGHGRFDQESCPICLEDMERLPMRTLAECGHVFHAPCISAWLSAKRALDRKCPVCKVRCALWH